MNKDNYMWQEENATDGSSHIFETRAELIRRRLSLVIINIVGFISTLGFSIVLTGAYPYLLQIDPDGDKRFLGWVIAANPIGQLISSPIVGWLGSKLGSVRWLCMMTGVLNLIGFTMYACLGAFVEPRRYWMILARFIVGIAAGSVTLCITYISKATTSTERTTYISINALVSTLGFIAGPAVQSALIPLGQDGILLGYGELRWNMYTSAGWLAASLSLVSITLFFPCIFQEFNMAEKEAKWNQLMRLDKSKDSQGKEADDTPPQEKQDLIGVFICIFNFSVAGFILIMIEALATPVAMDQLGYTEEEAVKKVGIVLSVGCILTAMSFASSGPVARRITERKALVCFGLVPLLLCHIVMMPFAGPTPPMQQISNLDSDIGTVFSETDGGNVTLALAFGSRNASNSTAHLGCPVEQEWCLTTPAIHAEQLIMGFMCIAVGYAFTATMSTSTMTQLLKAGQQGTWTGIYQAGGSLARILGPVYLTTMYTLFGPRATFGSIIAVLLVVIAINLYLFDHLIPLVRRGNIESPDLPRDTKKPIILSERRGTLVITDHIDVNLIMGSRTTIV